MLRRYSPDEGAAVLVACAAADVGPSGSYAALPHCPLHTYTRACCNAHMRALYRNQSIASPPLASPGLAHALVAPLSCAVANAWAASLPGLVAPSGVLRRFGVLRRHAPSACSVGTLLGLCAATFRGRLAARRRHSCRTASQPRWARSSTHGRCSGRAQRSPALESDCPPVTRTAHSAHFSESAI